MLVQNSYTYIKVGLAIRLLRNILPKSTKQLTTETIEDLVNCLKEGNFQVTLAAMESVEHVGIINELSEIIDANSEIGNDLALKIQKQFFLIETVVFPEANIKRIYILPNRRFNSEYLVSDPSKLLKEGTYEKLDVIARQDIASACRCILFGEATAAAFHILRATESVLKSFYFHHKKQHRLNKPMWGNMIDELRAKTKNKPSGALLSSLDLIRTAYRNPTQHPEASYEIDSAQDLFGVCLDVIGKMGSELEN